MPTNTTDKDFEFYFTHQKFITYIQWHHYFTAFFMLWGLASDLEVSLGHLVASKFLHCIIPTVVINLWHSTHSPIFQYKLALLRTQLLSHSGDNIYQTNNHKPIDFTSKNINVIPTTTPMRSVSIKQLKTKYKKMVTRNTFKMCCWFALLGLIDIGFFFGKLIPIGVTIFSAAVHDADGHHHHHQHNSHGGSEWLLYTLTLLIALGQIIFTIFILIAIRQMGNVKIYHGILDRG